MSKTRTRFAPSPTGDLHIGSLRTILFAYVIAKKHGGQFILRVEDTDQARKVAGAVERMIKIINWLGFEFDEGPVQGGDYGPYIQSERLPVYQEHANKLIKTGKAYRCFCTPERLQKMREDQQARKQPPRYDRHCLSLSNDKIKEKLDRGESFVVRQKMPADGTVKVVDELRGEIGFPAKDLDDQVLLKTDGFPTYQLAVVVDDHLMKISHVVRGEEWIPSFPKNWLLYEAFGWDKPKFIHMPLSLNKGGGKLSKRHGDVAVADFRAKGYLPEALVNFSALQGWNPYGKNKELGIGNNEEIFSLEEMIERFEIKDMGISPAVFDIEKLDYLNGYYIRKKSSVELLKLCRPYLQSNIALTDKDYKKQDDFLIKVIKTVQERLKRLSEVAEFTEFYFTENKNFDPEILAWKKMDKKQAKDNLKKLLYFIKAIDEKDWNEETLEKRIIGFIKENDYKIGEYLWPMRVALTGLKASPGPFEVASVLGKQETVERISGAINL